MAIFRDFRALVAAIRELVTTLQAILEAQNVLGPALERLETLERARAQFEAEMEGKWLQADGKLKAARNAEARERQLKRSYENNLFDPSDENGERGAEDQGILPLNAATGETEGVPPMRVDVAPSRRALALRKKYGM